MTFERDHTVYELKSGEQAHVCAADGVPSLSFIRTDGSEFTIHAGQEPLSRAQADSLPDWVCENVPRLNLFIAHLSTMTQ